MGRKHHHVLSKFERSLPSDHLLLTRFALQPPMSLLNRAIAQQTGALHMAFDRSLRLETTFSRSVSNLQKWGTSTLAP
jgi:hypothetical protein